MLGTPQNVPGKSVAKQEECGRACCVSKPSFFPLHNPLSPNHIKGSAKLSHDPERSRVFEYIHTNPNSSSICVVKVFVWVRYEWPSQDLVTKVVEVPPKSEYLRHKIECVEFPAKPHWLLLVDHIEIRRLTWPSGVIPRSVLIRASRFESPVYSRDAFWYPHYS